MVRVMKESSQSFSNAFEGVCDSIKELSPSMSISTELLAQSLAQPPQKHPSNLLGIYRSLNEQLYGTNFEQSFK